MITIRSLVYRRARHRRKSRLPITRWLRSTTQTRLRAKQRKCSRRSTKRTLCFLMRACESAMTEPALPTTVMVEVSIRDRSQAADLDRIKVKDHTSRTLESIITGLITIRSTVVSHIVTALRTRITRKGIRSQKTKNRPTTGNTRGGVKVSQISIKHTITTPMTRSSNSDMQSSKSPRSILSMALKTSKGEKKK